MGERQEISIQLGNIEKLGKIANQYTPNKKQRIRVKSNSLFFVVLPTAVPDM